MRIDWTCIILRNPGEPAVQINFSKRLLSGMTLFVTVSMFIGTWVGALLSQETMVVNERLIASAPIDNYSRESIQVELSGEFNINISEPDVTLNMAAHIEEESGNAQESEEQQASDIGILSVIQRERLSKRMIIYGHPNLKIVSLRNGEHLDIYPFQENGEVKTEEFQKIGHLFRCHRTGISTSIHPDLIRLLISISNYFDGKNIQLISGFRPVGVNGTAPTSRHVFGEAADIRVSGVTLQALRRASYELGAGGIGYYPDDGFIHVDVRRRQFFWEHHNGENFSSPVIANRFLPLNGLAVGGMTTLSLVNED